MTFIVDDTPAPKSLYKAIEELLPGKSLCAPDHSMNSVKVTASRVKADNPGRLFQTQNTKDGPRVWRLS